MRYFFIFAYGSLVNFDSAERTLHRKLADSDVTLAWLADYTRVWDYKSTVYADSLHKKETAVFLNLRPESSARVNGIVFRVDEDELDSLRKREANYSLVEITGSLTPIFNEPVFAFICSDKAALSDHDTNCVIMQKYIDLVKKGFLDQGGQFYEDYVHTTKSSDYQVVAGDYRFIEE